MATAGVTPQEEHLAKLLAHVALGGWEELEGECGEADRNVDGAREHGEVGGGGSGLAVEAHRGGDRVRRPVNDHVGEQRVDVVLGGEALGRVGPAVELFEDPRGETRRRVA